MEQGHHAIVDMLVQGKVHTYHVTTFGKPKHTGEFFATARQQLQRDLDLQANVEILDISTQIRPVAVGATVDLGLCDNEPNCHGWTQFTVKEETKTVTDPFGNRVKRTFPARTGYVPPTRRPDGKCGACFHHEKHNKPADEGCAG